MGAVEVRHVSKRFGSVRAVDGVSLAVERGEIFGLLGPNGAGKTTMIEMVTGLLQPDSGAVRILGHDMCRRAAVVRQRMGVQFQTTALFDMLTVHETLTLFGRFYRHAAPEGIIARLGLAQKSQARVATLSSGQRQRLALGIALVNDPDVVILDEPTAGLDPDIRRHVWEVIDDLRSRGKAVLMTTHYVEEAERLCDRVALMHSGRLVVEGSPRELIRQHFQLTAVCLGVSPLSADELRRLPSVASVQIDDGVVTVYSREVAATIASLQAMAAGPADLCDLNVRPATLEDVVLKLTRCH